MSSTSAPQSSGPPEIGRRTLSPFGYAVTAVVPILIAVIGIAFLHFHYDRDDLVTGQKLPLMNSDWRAGDDAGAAAIQGVLTLTQAGCVVLVTAEGNELDVVWPFDFVASVDNQVLKLYDTDRTIAARGGDTVTMGGVYDDVGQYAGRPCAPPAGTQVAFAQSEVDVTSRGVQ